MSDRWVISVEDHLNYEIVDIVLKEPIEPKDITAIGDDIEEKRKKRQILILSGRAPTWLYGYLVHRFCHLVKVVAVYDPKLQGGVVVSSHTRAWKEGEIIYSETRE